jgi:hypothetical protein
VLLARFALAELPDTAAQAPDLTIRHEQTGADRVQQLNNTLQGDHPQKWVAFKLFGF